MSDTVDINAPAGYIKIGPVFDTRKAYLRTVSTSAVRAYLVAGRTFTCGGGSLWSFQIGSYSYSVTSGHFETIGTMLPVSL